MSYKELYIVPCRSIYGITWNYNVWYNLDLLLLHMIYLTFKGANNFNYKTNVN